MHLLDNLPHTTPIFSYGRIDTICDLTSLKDVQFRVEFTVSICTYKLLFTQLTSRYTKEQEITHFIIKKLHDKGLGYRRIAKHLNSKNIKTFGGKKWYYNNVYSVLKRYLDRLEQLEYRNKTFDAEWSKMQLTYKRFKH